MGFTLLDYRSMGAPNDGLQTLEENQEGIGPFGDSQLYRKLEVGPCIAAEHRLEAHYTSLRAKTIFDHELDEARHVVLTPMVPEVLVCADGSKVPVDQ